MRRLALGLLAAALVLAAPADALEMTGRTQLTDRLQEVAFSTSSLRRPGKALVLLPDGYAAHPERRYPVLYLLHGGLGHYRDWINRGDVVGITKGQEVIVVMPEGGADGWFTDWRSAGKDGRPQWETFHVDELVPWVDTTYRTVADRSRRGIAGLSMGGFGAMSYAARNPDVFGWAASFSGAVDIVGSWPTQLTITAEAGAISGNPLGPFGDPRRQKPVWRAHNPVDLAEHLRYTRLFLAVGNGRPGPFDKDSIGDVVEQQMHATTWSLRRRLLTLGIGHEWFAYGNGTHSWPYWQRDLRTWLPGFVSGPG
ncbi:MAG: esterase family protein [Solirubrobacteraceae bacterium]|nr:esterase family protein [Solirubrobacteraceae bacterium]